MPPLPALKSSPGREHMTEKSYKSGQNFGSRLTLKAKDDDLLLFNQVKNQEGDNFLLHTADDFEDSLSKMRHFSGFKLGINIPTRGEAGDLLNVEGDKNDYDWLLTPPDTPLFSKLDEGVSQPIKLAPRGRIRSQPIPISRSVTEKSYRRSQTSYSPQRLNTSPRTSGTLARVGGRSSSSTQSSPPPVIQSTTPTRGSYSPPNKPYTPTHKSSTTTLPRTSTSSSNHAPNCGGRGASPVNETHVNLSFPKSQGWQKTFPGLNSDAPPNMRASSLAPSISHVRGSSPASRNEKELSMKLRRKSMSPTSSRSFGSSHGSEVHISSYCTYSGDFDEESLNSRTLGVSRSPPPRKAGSLANNKDMSFSRMPSKTSPSNSAPKRSFDSALRLMDQRRIPQNMFRPLLSGVPTTTFQPIYSRNSSLSTSSCTSSDQGVIIVAEDLEGTEIEQNVLYGGPKRTEDFDTHEEVFLFDKVDNKIKDTSDETLFGNSQALCEDFGEIIRYKSDLDDIQNAIVRTAIIKMNVKDDVPEVAGISVLLQGSSSTKWPILQGKALSATNILSSVPSYDRHNDNVLRRSIGLDSSSTTSVVNNDLSCSSTAEISCADDCSSSTYTDEDHQNSGSAVVNMERATDISLSSEMAEHHIMGNYTCENVILETGTNSSSIVTIESQDGYSESEEWKNECAPSHDPPSPELSNEHSVSQTSKNDMHLCSSESGAEVLENGASAIMVEGPRGRLSRNLTLEEATDTILFCSSIIHDLAYNAATIAAENEQEPLAEHLAPLPVTILEKSIPGLRGESAKMSTKPKPKPQKFKRKKVEIQPKAPLKEVVNTNIEGFTAPTDEFPRKLEVAKPPKLESKCSCSVM
ncbi:hypothetical protein KSP39_PZI019405 [Platanthera zijinensis]|uniref:Uncharacterized protein n=1 Tax=Platanthera zijinensis TaxID=2320716 RepID=A0AAP0B0W1_9ASPA